MKQNRRSYLELEIKYTEATQLLSMLIPKDVRRSQPEVIRADLLVSSVKLAIKADSAEDNVIFDHLEAVSLECENEETKDDKGDNLPSTIH